MSDHNYGKTRWILIRGVTIAPADPAIQGARGRRRPKQAARKYFLHSRPCSISGVYGFELFDEFVGTDPIRITHRLE